MLQAWEEIHLLNQDFTTFIRQDFDQFLYHNTPEHTISSRLEEYFASDNCQALIRKLQVFDAFEFSEIRASLLHSAKDKFRKVLV